ncbi:hypothetical protein FOZ63_008688, partial [Perkinsus olseni]
MRRYVLLPLQLVSIETLGLQGSHADSDADNSTETCYAVASCGGPASSQRETLSVTGGEDSCTLSWEASSEIRLRLGGSLMMPDRFNVTASRNDEGEYELETVTSWTRWGG